MPRQFLATTAAALGTPSSFVGARYSHGWECRGTNIGDDDLNTSKWKMDINAHDTAGSETNQKEFTTQQGRPVAAETAGPHLCWPSRLRYRRPLPVVPAAPPPHHIPITALSDTPQPINGLLSQRGQPQLVNRWPQSLPRQHVTSWWPTHRRTAESRDSLTVGKTHGHVNTCLEEAWSTHPSPMDEVRLNPRQDPRSGMPSVTDGLIPPRPLLSFGPLTQTFTRASRAGCWTVESFVDPDGSTAGHHDHGGQFFDHGGQFSLNLLTS